MRLGIPEWAVIAAGGIILLDFIGKAFGSSSTASISVIPSTATQGEVFDVSISLSGFQPSETVNIYSNNELFRVFQLDATGSIHVIELAVTAATPGTYTLKAVGNNATATTTFTILTTNPF